jgi:tRNA (guanine-N7-)-methyltransferase
MKPDHQKKMNFTSSQPADTSELELELGVPIPGRILPVEQWAKTGIKRLPEQGPIVWRDWFGRQAPVVLDIGCGNGRFVISSAVRRPEVDHLGIDILPVVIRYATRRGNQRGLSNARFAVCDGQNFLSRYVAPASLDEIHIYHPQPYHDHRGSRELRLLQPEFLGLLHRSLAAGGQLYLQSDNRPYWQYIRQVVSAVFEWHEQEGGWPEDPHGRSRRELQAVQQGLPIFRGYATKRKEYSEQQVGQLLASLPRPDFSSKKPQRRRVTGRREGPRPRRMAPPPRSSPLD